VPLQRKKLAFAESSDDPNVIISTWEEVRKTRSTSVRAKVNAALHESKGYRMLNDTDEEIELLRYVCGHGSKLTAGREAQARLAEIDNTKDETSRY